MYSTNAKTIFNDKSHLYLLEITIVTAAKKTIVVLKSHSCRRRPMTAAAFSTDGTVLAVAADLAITLWDPDTNILITVIGIPSTVNLGLFNL